MKKISIPFISLCLILASQLNASWIMGGVGKLAPILQDSRMQINPVIAKGPAESFLVAWQLGENIASWEKGDIFTTRVDSSGKVSDLLIPVCTLSASHQERPAITYNGNQFLVVWQDLRNNQDWDIYGCRILPDGTVLDPGGFLVAGGVGSQVKPKVASGPSGFMVVYQEKSAQGFFEIAGAWVGDNASVIKQTGPVQNGGFALMNGVGDLVRASDSTWLLSYADQSGLTNAAPVCNAILKRQGDQLLAVKVTRSISPCIGRDFLQGPWSMGKNTFLINEGNLALLFNSSGVMINPNTEATLSCISSTDKNTICLFGCVNIMQEGMVTTAFGQGFYLAVGLMEGVSNHLYVSSRISETGKRLDGEIKLNLYSGADAVFKPALAGNDSGFLVVFTEIQDTMATLRTFFMHFDSSVSSSELQPARSDVFPVGISPNPAHSVVCFKVQSSGIQSLRLFNPQGCLLADFSKSFSEKFVHQGFSWSESLSSGVYFMEVKTAQKKHVRAFTVLR